MTAKLSERRGPKGETQRAVLRLLCDRGPLQNWQISCAIGKRCDTTVSGLVKSGHIEKYQDDNRDPEPGKKLIRFQARYFVYVRALIDKPPTALKEFTLERYARALRAAGYTVEKPRK